MFSSEHFLLFKQVFPDFSRFPGSSGNPEFSCFSNNISCIFKFQVMRHVSFCSVNVGALSGGICVDTTDRQTEAPFRSHTSGVGSGWLGVYSFFHNSHRYSFQILLLLPLRKDMSFNLLAIDGQNLTKML